MSELDVQVVLDGVAAELAAPVALSDTEERLLAFTAHDELVDEVRLSGIMHRRQPAEVRLWFEQWGIREAEGPVRTPANEVLGALERWCVPVRFRGTHLGYVWVLDAGRISEDELAPAVEAASQIGAFLFRRRVSSQIDSDLLRLLLIPNPENENVASEVRAMGTFRHRGPIAVIVAGDADGDELSASERSDLRLAVQRTAEQAASDAALAGVISGLGVLLAPLRKPDDLAPARRMAKLVRDLAKHVRDDLGLVAAIGGAAELERASHSYAEARRALQLIRAMPDLGPVAAWDDLGVFRTLALLPRSDVEDSVLDRRVRELLADEGLAVTAETFLDLAGNVQETAGRLYVHRTTLYQRLDRIAALYELDLRRNGDHRLIAHLGFKLARMASF